MQTGGACPAPGEAPCTHGISEKNTAARDKHGPWTGYMRPTESSRKAPHTWQARSATRGEFGNPVIKDHLLLQPWGSLTSLFLKSLAQCTALKATTAGQDFQLWLSLSGNHFRQHWKRGKSPDTWRELQSITCRKPSRIWVTALDGRADTLSCKPSYGSERVQTPTNSIVRVHLSFQPADNKLLRERRESLYSRMRISKAARQTGDVCKQQTGELEHSQLSREWSDTWAVHAAARTATA